MRIRTACLALLLCAVPLTASAGPITGVYVVGDSLSDSGNAFIATGGVYPPSPPYAGRASNGPVAVEYLAQALGVTLAPSLAGGTNFAFAGATTGTDNALGIGPTGMLAQAAMLALSMPLIGPGDLFVVWGGPDDAVANPTPAGVAAAIGNLQTIITSLYGLGARNFLVPNIPDATLAPFGSMLPPDQQLALQLLIGLFNTSLSQMLAGLMLPGATITPFDTFALLNQIVANPAAFGLSNVTDACLQGLLPCGDPNSYLFWDDYHPTTAAHALVGQAFADAVSPDSVPEPATLVLVGLGLAAAARRRTMRARRIER